MHCSILSLFKVILSGILLSFALPAYSYSAPVSDETETSEMPAYKKTWRTLITEKIVAKRLKKWLKQAPLPELFVESRDSNCLIVSLKKGGTIEAQNVRIMGYDLVYQPCGNFKTMEKTISLYSVNDVKTLEGDLIFSSDARNILAADGKLRRIPKDNICAKIILGNGTLINAKNVRIGEREIIFSVCARPGSSEIAISRWYIHAVVDETGSLISTGGYAGGVNYNSYARKTETMSLLSFIFSLSTILLSFLSIPLLIAAIILGILGLRKINKNPGYYKGRGLAIAGIVIGIVFLLGASLLLAVFLSF